MEKKQSKADLLALRGGLRGRFRRVFDGMENAFEVLLDQLEHPLSPADRAGMAQLVRDMQTQLLGARRLGDQASDAATAAVLHSTCVPRPIDLLSQLGEICDILREEAARYDLPFTIELQTAGQSVLPTVGDAALLNGLMTNLISNTLSADAGACISTLGRSCSSGTSPPTRTRSSAASGTPTRCS